MKINKENLIKIWKSKDQILEGIVNSVFKREHIEEIAQERLAICASNACGLYDADGSSERAVVKGSPACAGCGCKLEYKTRAMATYCYLQDMGEHPLWVAVLTPAEAEILEDRLRKEEQSKTEE